MTGLDLDQIEDRIGEGNRPELKDIGRQLLAEVRRLRGDTAEPPVRPRGAPPGWRGWRRTPCGDTSPHPPHAVPPTPGVPEAWCPGAAPLNDTTTERTAT